MLRPRVKKTQSPESISNNRIRMGSLQYGVGAIIQDDEGHHIWKLLKLMDGTRDESSIVKTMLADDNGLDADSVRDAMTSLVDGGFIEDSGSELPRELSPAEISRYDRSLQYFSWVDIKPRASPFEQQRMLKRSRVVVLGLGGVGTAVSASLVAAGIGTILCVDFDKVEESNLNRQILYTEDDIGKSKVDAAVDRLKRMNHYVSVKGLEHQVQSTEGAKDLMAGCDLFFHCADKPPEIDVWINEAALETLTPWIDCSYAGPMIVTGLTVPFKTSCCVCRRHFRDQVDLRQDGSEKALLTPENQISAAVPPSANISGHFAALEGIYFLTNLRPQTVGRVLHQNLIAYDHVYYVEPPIWEECPACQRRASRPAATGLAPEVRG